MDLTNLDEPRFNWQKKEGLKNKTDGKEPSINECNTDSDQLSFFHLIGPEELHISLSLKIKLKTY
jgi:hypothetical protein